MSHHEFLRCSFGIAAASAAALLITACGSNDMSEFLEIEEDPLYSFASFPIGIAVGDKDLLEDNIHFRSLSVHHFNNVTAGNSMKMDALHPSEGTYAWENADFIVDFAQQYDKQIHSHVLVWHSHDHHGLRTIRAHRQSGKRC